MESIRQFLTSHPNVDYLLRIFLALLLGFLIGFERKYRSKEAGIRTHAIVAVGAALYTIISKYGFYDVDKFDSSRVAAQIVAGVGFLGAGMIMHQRHVIHGLTTAAGIWATAGVGMAAAAGLWQVALGTTALIVGVQLLLHADINLFRMKRFVSYRIAFKEVDGARENILKDFSSSKFARLKTERKDDGLFSVATLKTDKEYTDSIISKILEDYPFVTSIESFIDDFE